MKELVEEPSDDGENQQNCAPWWKLYVYGAVNTNGVGAGIVLIGPEGHQLHNSVRFDFRATNNDAEYKALIARSKIGTQDGS